MQNIQLNHAQILYNSVRLNSGGSISSTPPLSEEPAASSPAASPSVIVKLSSAALIKDFDQTAQARFHSDEERSNNLAEILAQWVTLEELENGTRRYATEENERLGQLTLKELIDEEAALPYTDENGYLRSDQEQAQRIGIAKANLFFEAEFQRDKAAESVESSLSEFKTYLQDTFQIDPDSYDIVYRDGKPTAEGRGMNGSEDLLESVETLQKIQDILDNPDGIEAAEALAVDIKNYNNAMMSLMDYNLTSLTYVGDAKRHYSGGDTPYLEGKNTYLAKAVSMERLMEGVSYSSVTKIGLTPKDNMFIELAAEAGKKQRIAIADSTHASNYDTPLGLIELDEIRKKYAELKLSGQ